MLCASPLHIDCPPALRADLDLIVGNVPTTDMAGCRTTVDSRSSGRVYNGICADGFNELHLNNGDGVFAAITTTSLTQSAGGTVDIAVGDYGESGLFRPPTPPHQPSAFYHLPPPPPPQTMTA